MRSLRIIIVVYRTYLEHLQFYWFQLWEQNNSIIYLISRERSKFESSVRSCDLTDWVRMQTLHWLQGHINNLCLCNFYNPLVIVKQCRVHTEHASVVIQGAFACFKFQKEKKCRGEELLAVLPVIRLSTRWSRPSPRTGNLSMPPVSGARPRDVGEWDLRARREVL